MENITRKNALSCGETMTDTEYLKMILALDPKFFDRWKWSTGDKAIIMCDKYKREVILLDTAPMILLNENEKAELLYPGSINGDKIDEYYNNLRPVPSQEQLQEMYIKFQMERNKVSEGKALTLFVGHFADFLSQKHESCYNIGENWGGYDTLLELNSMSIWTLQFVVGVIYELGWDFINSRWVSIVPFKR